jgi:hypothetical protein
MIRPFKASDEATLKDIYESTGYNQRPFPDLSKVLATAVLADDHDVPVMAAYMHLVPEGTLICPRGTAMHPLVKLSHIASLHENLRDVLVKMGYDEAIASVPPQLNGYRRHLQRHLNWQESWPTYRVFDVPDWRRS